MRTLSCRCSRFRHSRQQAMAACVAQFVEEIATMKTTIDAAGRVVIPSRLRREAGLTPGMVLDVRLDDGRIEIEPAPLSIKLERRGRLLVAVPQQSVPVLTAEMVDKTRQAVRRDREMLA